MTEKAKTVLADMRKDEVYRLLTTDPLLMSLVLYKSNKVYLMKNGCKVIFPSINISILLWGYLFFSYLTSLLLSTA